LHRADATDHALGLDTMYYGLRYKGKASKGKRDKRRAVAGGVGSPEGEGSKS